jgi:glycosyltransferase involved in cell wall biosynthesis
MKDIEIIFVDDCSTDNSIKILEDFQKRDERIIIIKNEKNRGTLICRNEGIYAYKGEYIMFPDSDDLLLYNVLDVTYNLAKKNNTEIVEFAVLKKRGKRYSNKGTIRKNNTPIYQPELSSLSHYSRGFYQQTDWHLWGKLIKREALYRTLDNINKYYLNSHMSLHEDALIDFMLLRKAKSFIYIYYYGYLYVIHATSKLRTMNKNINKSFKDNLLYLKFVFEHTANNTRDKYVAAHEIKNVFNHFYQRLNQTTENFEFIINVFNLVINSTLIRYKIRKRAILMKNRVIEVQTRLNKTI